MGRMSLDGCGESRKYMWSSPARKRGRTKRPATQLHILDQSTFGQRHRHAIPHHDVIQQPDIHQRQRFLDLERDEFIGTAGFGNAGRMLGFIRECQHSSYVPF